MKRTLAVGTGMLLAALVLPAIAQQSPSTTQSQSDPEVQRLRNQVAQLGETLNERRASRRDTVDAWQQRYQEKVDALRERQQFEDRYLSHE